MTRSSLVVWCLVLLVLLAAAVGPGQAESSCCAMTYKCQLRNDCRCLMREIRCRDPSQGILNSGKRSAPGGGPRAVGGPDGGEEELQGLGDSNGLRRGDARVQPSLLRRALRLVSMDDGLL